MDGRPTLTDCDEARDYVVPNVLSPRDLVFRPDNMDETVQHTILVFDGIMIEVAGIQDRILLMVCSLCLLVLVSVSVLFSPSVCLHDI